MQAVVVMAGVGLTIKPNNTQLTHDSYQTSCAEGTEMHDCV